MKIEDPELHQLFEAESAEYLQRLDEGLTQLESSPDDQELLVTVFRDIHSLKGAARMLGAEDLESLAHAVEDWFGAAKRGQITLDSGLLNTLHDALHGMRRLIEEVLTGHPSGIDLLGMLERLQNPTATSPPRPAEPSNKIGQTAQPIATPPTASRPQRPDAETSVPFPSMSSKPPANSHASQAAAPSLPISPQLAIQTIRVDAHKLDTFLTQTIAMRMQIKQMGEQLKGLAQVSHIQEEWARTLFEARVAQPPVAHVEHQHSAALLAQERETTRTKLDQIGIVIAHLMHSLESHQHRMERLVMKLEDQVRTARLLPFSTLFRVFPRMVKDLAPLVGKQASLIVTGGDILVDKVVIESLKDPLMHLIRNALDHGLEPPGQRIDSGKPPEGTLSLSAKHTATHTVLEIRDDGKGLDREAIIRKATLQGLMTDDHAPPLTSEEVLSLIFHPGFSTKSEVSQLSGRGMGMEIVRAQVEALHGTVHIESTPHCGTAFRLHIPLSLTSTRVLLTRIGPYRLGIPLDCVEHTLEVDPHTTFSLEGQTAMIYREHPLFLSSLTSLLALSTGPSLIEGMPHSLAADQPHRTCLVLAIGERRWGILVEGFSGEEEVVMKPTGGILQRVRNVAGSGILKDGTVCVILHPDDLLKSAQKAGMASRSIGPQ